MVFLGLRDVAELAINGLFGVPGVEGQDIYGPSSLVVAL